MRRRAVEAWEEAELEPIGLHEARHTFASLMIAASVDAMAISTWMGHSSIQITYDRYGHLLNHAHEEAVRRVDAFLAGQPPARLREV